MRRTWTIPAIVALFGVAAIGITVHLQQDVRIARDAQLELQQAKLSLSNLENAPFKASPDTGGSPKEARALITMGHEQVARALGQVNEQSPPATIGSLTPLLRKNDATIERIFRLGASGTGYGAEADQLAGKNAQILTRMNGLLDAAAGEYESRANRSRTEGGVAGAMAILLLLAAFGFYYRRSARSAEDNRRLLEETRRESVTDALTGLNNRRALMGDLAEAVRCTTTERSTSLTLFDLDGFKHYNDTFGHPAGDILLARLSGRLLQAMAEIGSVYRMGGDEFCLLASLGPGDDPEALAGVGSEALSESGTGFDIGCSSGSAVSPADTSNPEQMLNLADQRMYATKASGRRSARRQTTDVLLQVLSERSHELGEHGNAVAALVEPLARRLDLSEAEVKRTHDAAELHDIGKSGVPDSILNKAGPLDEEEWKFMHRHTMIGERIILAAPSLASCADLVRSSHERFDGTGYPDGLAGDEIPLGSRIIFACDAFDAMTSKRPYKSPISAADAISELRLGAGSQFDPVVIEGICAEVEHRRALRTAAVTHPAVEPV
jgi:diguanylate cyclase (GGDEF)-like protein